MLPAAALLAVAACTSCRHKKHNSGDEIPAIEVAHPLTDSVVLRKTYPGYLTANREVELVARVDGYLLSHPYKAGDRVRKGEKIGRASCRERV